MTTASYERYGLTSNPFRDLSSETLADVEVFHVNLQGDDALRTIKEEVFEKENKAIVAIVGGNGAGKTERLLLAAQEARARNAFTIYFDITAKTAWVLKGLAEEFEKAAKAGGYAKLFSSPAWLRGIHNLQKVKGATYDPSATAKAIATALNDTAPSFLLLNDLHNLSSSAEVDAFTKTLQELADQIKPGVLLMFGCYPVYLTSITRNRPALASRINRTFVLPTLTVDEAGLLLAKKLLAKRLVEDLDPLYPFDREAVAMINESAYGNPRRLLELADRAIEYGVTHRAYRIDAEAVRAALAPKTMAEAPAPVVAPAAHAEAPAPAPAAARLSPPTTALSKD
ncbi:MAG TPA: AAA family ATPase [Thermoplasmata archaeon]|nr:AAA family ATPase [Thermoplasmata archaeon]